MASELTRRRLRLDPRLFASSANQHRTPGIHLTDVLKDMEVVSSGGRPIYEGERTEDDLSDYAIQGYLWEDEIMRGRVRQKAIDTAGRAIGLEPFVGLPELAVSLGREPYAFQIDPDLGPEMNAELARGCVIMTADGGIGETIETIEAIAEVKWLTKSANMNPEKDRRLWFPQVRGYLFGWSVYLGRVISDVFWHVQFACGTWKGDPPIYEEWHRRYEQAEIWRQWESVAGHIGWRVGPVDGRGGGDDPHGWKAHLA